jgi:hypothetical protein
VYIFNPRYSLPKIFRTTVNVNFPQSRC